MTNINMMAPGYYSAKPSDWNVKTVGANNTLCVEVTFEMTDGEHAGNNVDYRGFLTEKTLTKTLKHLVACGFNDKSLEGLADGVAGNALDRAKVVRVQVKHEEYKGKTYTKVTGVYEATKPVAKVNKALLPNIAAAMLEIKAEKSNEFEAFNDLPF